MDASFKVETLESRCTPATFFVTSSDDNGTGSGDSGDLRYCITQANASSGPDVILVRASEFNSRSVNLQNALPTITGDLEIRPENTNTIVSILRNGGFAILPPEPQPGIPTEPVSGPGSSPPSGTGQTEPGQPTSPPIGAPIGPGIPPFPQPPKFRILDIVPNVNVALSNIGISNGEIEGDGGNIRNLGTLTLNDVILSVGNASQRGGNIFNAGTLTISDSQLNSGFALDSGGGIFNDGSLTIRTSSIAYNSAGDSGGGIRNRGSLTIENSSIAFNSANDSGGGIRSQDGKVQLTNVTIAFNTSDADNSGAGEGGGIRLDGLENDAVLRNTLVAQNRRAFGGTIPTDLVAQNPRDVGEKNFDDISGAITGAFNLVGVNRGLSGIVNGVDGNRVGTIDSPIDPMLVETVFFDDGSLGVIAFLAASPARDAGDPSNVVGAVDGRGMPRVFGGRIDIGAFESDGTDPVIFVPLPLPIPPPEPFPGEENSESVFAVGGDVGSTAVVTVYRADGTEILRIQAYEVGFTGGVRTSVGDVNGDGTPDIITAPGPGRAPLIKVFNGKDGTLLSSFLAFEESFTGGVFVVAADMNRDGFADIIVAPDQGGGPRCRVLNGKSNTTMADFFGIEDSKFRGGVRIAARDLNGDGIPDLLLGAGFGGGPRIAGFDGSSIDDQLKKLFADFFVFEDSLRNGVFVSAGDLNDDTFGDLMFGAGPGGGPRVFVLSGKELIGSATQVPLANFFVGDENDRGGVRVTSKDLDDDGRSDLVCGSGEGDGNTISTYLAADLIKDDGGPMEPNREFEATFSNQTSAAAAFGVYVG